MKTKLLLVGICILCVHFSGSTQEQKKTSIHENKQIGKEVELQTPVGILFVTFLEDENSVYKVKKKYFESLSEEQRQFILDRSKRFQVIND